MSFFSWCQIVRFIMLVPNCPGAKLSGAKLSVFIMLVPNCPSAKLSWCQIVRCQIVRRQIVLSPLVLAKKLQTYSILLTKNDKPPSPFHFQVRFSLLDSPGSHCVAETSFVKLDLYFGKVLPSITIPFNMPAKFIVWAFAFREFLLFFTMQRLHCGNSSTIKQILCSVFKTKTELLFINSSFGERV